MEEKLTNQEEQLRALSDNFTSHIDTAELWDNIEGRLPSDARHRRPLVWWFVLGGAIILGGLLIGHYTKLDPSESANLDVVLTNSQEIIAQKSRQESSTTSAPHTSKTPLLTSSITDDDITSGQKEVAPVNQQTDQQSYAIVDMKKQDAPLNEYNGSKALDHNLMTFNKRSEFQGFQKLPTHGTFDQIYSKATDLAFLPMPQVKAPIDWKLLPIGSPQLLERVNAQMMPNPKIIPSSRPSWLPYFFLSGGASLNHTSLTSNTGEALDLKPFENERPLIGVSSSLGFGFENSEGWRIGFGLTHHRLVNRFSLQERVAVTETVEGTVFSSIDQVGNVTDTQGSLIKTTVTDYDLTVHRMHDLLNLQLNIGKRIIRQGRFALYLDARLARNVRADHQGYYFTEGAQVVTPFEDSRQAPYTNAGYSAGLGMDIEYRINQFSINLTSFAEAGLNSMTIETNYYQIKNSQYGVQLGIVYRP